MSFDEIRAAIIREWAAAASAQGAPDDKWADLAARAIAALMVQDWGYELEPKEDK